MRRIAAQGEEILLVAPTLRRARAAQGVLRERLSGRRLRPISARALLSSPRAASTIVLCPAGKSVVEDLEFLRGLAERALWRAPERDLYDAIAGLRADLPALEERRARRGGKAPGPALLLEGIVSADRARHALGGDARHWIVERAALVRLSSQRLAVLRQAGVRWSALYPFEVLGLLASAGLARARRRLRGVLPARTPVWVWDGRQFVKEHAKSPRPT